MTEREDSKVILKFVLETVESINSFDKEIK